MANYPNRCQHLKINGTQCGSPALRRNRFCFFHKRFQDERIRLSSDRARRAPATFILPVLEDANSIQIALMQVMRLLVSGQIEHKTASLLLYALQTASTNLRMTQFSPHFHEVILDPRDARDSFLNSQLWNDRDFEDDEEEDDDEVESKEEVTAEKHPEVSVRVDEHRKAIREPHPDQKKPVASMNPAAIRAKITGMVEENLPALAKTYIEATQAKKAT